MASYPALATKVADHGHPGTLRLRLLTDNRQRDTCWRGRDSTDRLLDRRLRPPDLNPV